MLSTAFRQNLLASMEASALHLTALAELAGAGPEQIATPRRAAADRGPDGYLIALSSPTSQPLLATLRDRETRRRLFEASAGRATAGEHDNRPVAVQIAQLRARRAELLGFPTHAAATLADTAAGTTEAVDALLAQLVAPAVANAPARRRSLPSVPPGTGSASQRRGIGPITPRSCAPSGTASTRRRCDRTSSSTPPSPTEAQAIRDAQQWGEGFRAVEYLAATLLDQAWHRLAPGTVVTDADAFEREALERAGITMELIPPRYRTAYFQHIFSSGYSAGYYSYLWGRGARRGHGGVVRRPSAGDTFRSTVLSVGGAVDFMAACRALLGREPDVAPLLVRRGLKSG